jgi:hypothetical protein
VFRWIAVVFAACAPGAEDQAAPPVCMPAPPDPTPVWSTRFDPHVRLRILDTARLTGDVAGFERLVRTNFGSLRYCYEPALKAGRRPAGRMIVLLGTAVADDATESVDVRVILDEVGDPGLAACTVAKLRRLHDPGVTGDALVEISYTWWQTVPVDRDAY